VFDQSFSLNQKCPHKIFFGVFITKKGKMKQTCVAAWPKHEHKRIDDRPGRSYIHSVPFSRVRATMDGDRMRVLFACAMDEHIDSAFIDAHTVKAWKQLAQQKQFFLVFVTWIFCAQHSFFF